jgi:hypothetical protein
MFHCNPNLPLRPDFLQFRAIRRERIIVRGVLNIAVSQVSLILPHARDPKPRSIMGALPHGVACHFLPLARR